MGWMISVLGTALLLVLIVTPAYAGPRGGHVIMAAFSNFCHQIAERSPHLHDVQLAVCHRCLGIYAGLFLGTLSLPFARLVQFVFSKARFVVPSVVVLLGTDWLLDVIGLIPNSVTSRFATGLAFGFVAGVLFARAMSMAFSNARGSRERAVDADPALES